MVTVPGSKLNLDVAEAGSPSGEIIDVPPASGRPGNTAGRCEPPDGVESPHRRGADRRIVAHRPGHRCPWLLPASDPCLLLADIEGFRLLGYPDPGRVPSARAVVERPEGDLELAP